jgi:hypothetical protein
MRCWRSFDCCSKCRSSQALVMQRIALLSARCRVSWHRVGSAFLFGLCVFCAGVYRCEVGALRFARVFAFVLAALSEGFMACDDGR